MLPNIPPWSDSSRTRCEAGFLADAVDDAAGAAAPEDHRVRSLERLDPLEVIEVAVVLHVVAHTVDEEVRGRAVAADDHLVAVVLPLVHHHARHVAEDVADAHHHLVPDQFLGDDGDRLRHVAERRGGLGGADVTPAPDSPTAPSR